jgi:hypothetical protein
VLLGNSIVPGLGDRYLAANGYESQMTDEPETPGRPDNLDQPLPGDHGAHGRFDERAASRSTHWWLSRNRGWLLAGLGIAGLCLLNVSTATATGDGRHT